MLRLLTAAIVIGSYFEIRINLPRLTALAVTHSYPGGQSVGVIIGPSLWTNLSVQICLSALFLFVPSIARRSPELVHFGWRRLSDYTPEQRERIMPLLQRMMELGSLLTCLAFGLCNHLFIQASISAGPLLPADWSQHIVRSALLSMGAMTVAWVVLTVYYLRKFGEAARAQ